MAVKNIEHCAYISTLADIWQTQSSMSRGLRLLMYKAPKQGQTMINIMQLYQDFSVADNSVRSETCYTAVLGFNYFVAPPNLESKNY